MRGFAQVLSQVVRRWRSDALPHHAAALAFYTLLALAPLLVVLLAAVGYVYGFEETQARVVEGVSLRIGEDAGRLVHRILSGVGVHTGGVLTTAASLLVSLFAASNVFYQAKFSIDTIWRVGRTTWGAAQVAKKRLLSAALVFCAASLVLCWLILDATVRLLREWLSDWLPSWLLHRGFAEPIITWFLVTLMFAILYVTLPPERIGMRHVWAGAAIGALLVATGQRLLLWYVEVAGVQSAYGAAVGPVLVLLWVYVSSLAFFLGGEMVLASCRPDRPQPLPTIT
ncbi:MAG: YihY/virulence factor BrkB family protein [Fimbriimonadia bacterium]|jgi:membrane protein